MMQAELEAAANAFRSIQKDMQKAMSNKQRLVSQQLENEQVKKELSLLEDDAEVYKLVGPTLLLQDVDEARANVQKRLQFIGDELTRNDHIVKDLEKKADEKRRKIMEIQQAAQAKMAANAAA